MAASFYKWLFIPVLGIVLSSAKPVEVHPFHVSVTEINHNAADKTLELSCKIFTDDFEKVLAKNYKTKVDLAKEELKTAMDSLVKKYVLSHLTINADGRPMKYSYLGFEIESEAAYAYIEISNISTVSTISIVNTILYDLFDDQLNIIHVTVGGKRKSTKLNYPDKEVSFSF
jgi:hypothetical protein